MGKEQKIKHQKLQFSVSAWRFVIKISFIIKASIYFNFSLLTFLGCLLELVQESGVKIAYYCFNFFWVI